MWPQIAILILHIPPLPNERQRLSSSSDRYHPVEIGLRLDANVRRERNIRANVHDAFHAGRPWIVVGRRLFGLFEESRVIANAEMRRFIGLRIVLVAHASEPQTTLQIVAEQKISVIGKAFGQFGTDEDEFDLADGCRKPTEEEPAFVACEEGDFGGGADDVDVETLLVFVEQLGLANGGQKSGHVGEVADG